MRGFLVTGTDTGVGKTHVTAALAQSLRRLGHRVLVRKPVATGATWHEGQWRCDDTVRLAEAAGETDLDRVTPWAFSEPAAPPVAAEAVGATLHLEQLAEAARRGYVEEAILLVEGVGGLLCPLTRDETVADLAAVLGLPLVVVARRSLGTLNHTLLTLEVAARRGLRVAGVVVNETEAASSLAERTNVEQLRIRIDVPLLAVVPYDPGGSAAAAALAAVDWWARAEA